MKSKPPKVEIEDFSFQQSRYKRGDKVWMATNLKKAAEAMGVEPFDMPIAGIALSVISWDICNQKEFAFHYKRVMQCDLTHPIILDDFGQIADGQHRVMKALIEGKHTIKAWRLQEMPPYDYLEED